MNTFNKSFRLGFALLFFFLTLESRASPVVETLSTNLAPAIERAAQNPRQFAVPVSKSIDASTDGVWTITGDQATWSYAVQIPDAVSMSFHAVVRLPSNAVLADAAHTYRSRDVPADGSLWGRVGLGDTLTLTLSVPVSQRSAVRFHIDELQAGFRGLSSSVAPSRAYRQLQAEGKAAADSSSCAENYECDVTDANTGPAHAIVAVTLKNKLVCSGTLLNDTAGDRIPHVLTAQHCDSDTTSLVNAAVAADAATMVFYFDAVTPCGQTLGTIYQGTAQQGATTEALAGDAWLVRMSGPPVVSDAYFAGWDSTGTAFQGGYAIHHGGGTSKQYTSYIGQAVVTPFKFTRYSSDGSTAEGSVTENQWGVNNQVGWNPPGASGGGLFDPSNRVVGSYTSYTYVSDSDHSARCPASPPVAPSAGNINYMFQQLADVFAGKPSDPAATTATIQSYLDAGNTGQMVIDGLNGVTPPPPAETFTSSAATITVGQSVTLTWDAPDASACSASGNWNGALAASGTYTYTPPSTGPYTYTLACSNAGGSVSRSVNLSVVDPAPTETLSISASTITAGQSATITWQSTNVNSCSATGAWSGTFAASGSSIQTPASAGSYSYQLACSGSGGTVTQAVTLTVNPGASAPAPAPGSGGGGGGPVPPVVLGLVSLALLVRRKRRRS